MLRMEATTDLEYLGTLAVLARPKAMTNHTMPMIAWMLLACSLISIGCVAEERDPVASDVTIHEVRERHAWDYVGLTEAQATEAARSNGVTFRVYQRDGQSLPLTRDLRPGRINALVIDGHVYYVRVEQRQIDNEGTTDPALLPYLGLSEADARALAATQGRTVRVVQRDDESFTVTTDYRPDRLNLVIRGGMVEAVSAG